MEKIEIEIKEFSTKKLKEIIEVQSNAYSEMFIDFAKNELIRRGESFAYDTKMQKEIKEMGDDDLKKVVEKERASYHLEYLELAIQEYLVRGFKNETGYEVSTEEGQPEVSIERRYPALRTFSGLYWFMGLLSLFDIAIVLFGKWPTWLTILLISFCVIAGITFFAGAEAIKVFLDIEENTRRKAS